MIVFVNKKIDVEAKAKQSPVSDNQGKKTTLTFPVILCVAMPPVFARLILGQCMAHGLSRGPLFKPLTVIPGCQIRKTFSSSSPSQDNSSKEASLLLSETCVKRLKEIAPDGNQFLRVLVEGGGCSGFQYKFNLETGQLEADDKVFEREGARVVIDESSLDFLKGSTIDYHTELIRSAFRIVDNPVADQGCSCGASFSVKLD